MSTSKTIEKCGLIWAPPHRNCTFRSYNHDCSNLVDAISINYQSYIAKIICLSFSFFADGDGYSNSTISPDRAKKSTGALRYVLP